MRRSGAQLAVVPEHKLFLYLSDGEVQYTHLEHFTAPDSLPRCRGASCFALDWQKLRGVSSFSRELRVCVASRRKLFLYRYTKNTFVLMKVCWGAGHGAWLIPVAV